MSEESIKKIKSSLKSEKKKNSKFLRELTHLRKILIQQENIGKESKTKYDEFINVILKREEEGRQSVSRELHDEVAQILAGINIELAVLLRESSIHEKKLLGRISDTQKLLERLNPEL